MKKAEALSCASKSERLKIPFTAATSGSISEVMKPQAKNSVVTEAKANCVFAEAASPAGSSGEAPDGMPLSIHPPRWPLPPLAPRQAGAKAGDPEASGPERPFPWR
jgi:hypothetical protein